MTRRKSRQEPVDNYSIYYLHICHRIERFFSLSGNSRVLRNGLQSPWHKKRMLAKPHAISRINGFRKGKERSFKKEKGRERNANLGKWDQARRGVPEMPKARCRALFQDPRVARKQACGTHPPKNKSKIDWRQSPFFCRKILFSPELARSQPPPPAE